MGHHVRIENATDIDIARAEGIVGLVRTLNPDVKESITRFVAEFYTVWANGISGQLNFHDEAVKVGRTFKKLLDNNPDDEADLADAFCLAIRTEINRIEDEASNYIPSTGPLPDSPQEIAIWWAAQEQAQKDRAVGILWGTLPPFEEASTARNRAAFFRHKLGAVIQVYQYARNFYEGHTPKQFSLRPNLPAFYTTAPTVKPLNNFTTTEPERNALSTVVATHTGQLQEGKHDESAIPAGAFSSLLLNYSIAELTALLAGLGLISTTNGHATPAATPGAWTGIIYGLLEAKRPRLTGTKAAIWRAFSDTFKAKGSDRAVQCGLGKRGSIAEQFRARALSILDG